MNRPLAVVGLGVPLLVALMLGPGAFAAVVVVVAALLLVDVSGLLSRVGSRPIVLVALVPGVAMPLAVARDPGSGWEAMPAWLAATVIGGFALVLLFGRRSHLTEALGATLLAGLLVGLGGSGLLLLRDLDHGFRWVLGMGLLAGAADAGGAGLSLARRRQPPGEGGVERLGALAELAVAALAVGVGAGVVAAVLDPPFTPRLTGLVALVALTAALGGGYLQRSLAVEAGVDPDDEQTGVGEGLLLRVADVVLLAAPAVYVVARSTVL